MRRVCQRACEYACEKKNEKKKLRGFFDGLLVDKVKLQLAHADMPKYPKSPEFVE
jgi:hypothetical protein